MRRIAAALVLSAAVGLGADGCREPAHVGTNGLVLGDQQQVLVAEANGDVRALATGYSPSWSPDGRRIAFLAPQAAGPGAALRTVAADGRSRPRTVAADVFGAAWVPGRNQLAATLRRGRHTRLVTLRVDGSHVAGPPRVCGSAAAGYDAAANAACSPDRRWIAHRTRTQDLVITRRDGSDRRPLITGSGFTLAGWAPDSTRLAVAVARAGSPTRLDLDVVGVRGGPPRRIARMLALVAPAWSPDGRRIAFVSEHGVETIAPDGFGRRVVVPAANASITALAWSPGGTRFVFSAFRTPAED